MIIGLLLLFGLAAPIPPPVVEAEAPRRVVTLMPLLPTGTLTGKQARGVGLQLRAAVQVLVAESALRLLPLTKDDEAALRKCADDDPCFSDLARLRGADFIAVGSVGPGEGGLVIDAHVLAVSGGAAQPFSATLTGADVDNAALDRLARELFAPDTLRGSLRVQGQPGDEVSVDGRRRGTIGPAGSDDDKSFSVDGLLEAVHVVEVSRPMSKNGIAYEAFSRSVPVRHRETTTIGVTLLPKASTPELAGDASSSLPPTVGPLVTLGVGAALVGGGVVFGVLSLLDSLAVEERAERQQLVFPRDQDLVARGSAFSVVANVCYGIGISVAGAAGVWWWLNTPREEP